MSSSNSNGILPYNVDAEQATLGSLLIDPNAIVKTFDAGIKADDFFIKRNSWVFQVIFDLQQADIPANLINISDELERRGQLDELGGAAYLTQLMNITPSSIWTEHYAKVIKRTSIMRQLVDLSGKIAKMAHSDQMEADEAIQAASDMLLDVTKKNQTSEPSHIGAFCSDALDQIERLQHVKNGILGIPTGLTDLDKILGGLQQGKLILVAGRPAMGKSSLVLQMATNAAKNHSANVLFFSLEMLGVELTQRIISAEAGIDGKVLQRGPIENEHYKHILRVLGETDKLSIHIDDKTVNIEDIRAKAIAHQYKYGSDLIIVDYIQRVQVGKRYQNRDAEIGAVSGALKKLANNLQVPVVAVSSLSRACEARENKRPMLKDLRESGNLEYDADVVIFIYCDDVYNVDTETPNVAEVNIAKHRGGARGMAWAYFDRPRTQFKALEKRTVDFRSV